jgi:hypothetical protein
LPHHPEEQIVVKINEGGLESYCVLADLENGDNSSVILEVADQHKTELGYLDEENHDLELEIIHYS